MTQGSADIPGGHRRDTPSRRDPQHTVCDHQQVRGGRAFPSGSALSNLISEEEKEKMTQDTC